MFIICTIVLSSLYGAYTAHVGIFPGSVVQEALQAARSLEYAPPANDANPYPSELWHTSRYERPGAIIHDADAIEPGLTLVSNSGRTKTVLIQSDGTIAHEWAWDSGQDAVVYFSKTWVFPNGDLIANYVLHGELQYGHGLVKLDRDSKLIWDAGIRAHHDFDITPSGDIVTLTNEVVHEHTGIVKLPPPYLDDRVTLVSPNGVPQKSISILGAFKGSDFQNVVVTPAITDPREDGDYLHANTVKYVTPELSAVFPFLKPGEVFLSLRNASLLVALDLETEKITWALRGPWVFQHDPDLLPNGHILLFDNLGALGPGGRSRVIEFDPTDGRLIWEFKGTPDARFESGTRGSQQRLPGGNTLITEATEGRLLEVTPSGKIVWEYHTPTRAEKDPRLVPVSRWATRIPESELPFLRATSESG